MLERVTASILDAYQAALVAIEPERLTRDALRKLEPSATTGYATVIAIGKAAAAMARGTDELTGANVLVIADQVAEVPQGAELIVGSHPRPDASSRQAATRALEVASQIPPGHLAVFLISGGGSSLAELPAPGLSIDDLAATFDALTTAQIPIAQMNLVRRHLSAIKNGRLLAARGPGPSVSLVVSDVIDGPPSDVASGPTLSDGTTALEALELIRNVPGIPKSVLTHLQTTESVPTVDHHTEVIADRHTAANGAAEALERGRALRPAIIGNAESAASDFIAGLNDQISIGTGETTVQVVGTGTGGRNQTAALAAAAELADGGPSVFAALATDGIDGPTDAAGAIVDNTTTEQITDLDVLAHLADNNAYVALDQAHALIRTGPTGTNVGDIWFGWRAAT